MILKRDSSVIFCRIIKEDSLSIYFRQSKGEQTTESNIYKTDVLSYYNRSALIKNELNRADSLALVQAKRDSSQIKKDTIQTKVVAVTPKKDTIQIKRDTLQQKAIDLKPQGDTIALNANYKCFYRGELITRGEALALMKGNMEAYQEMKKARGYFAPVIPLGLGAAVLAGVFVADAVSNGNFHWVVGGSSVLLTAIAITLKQTCNIHIDKSVKFYNAKPGVAAANIPKFELGVASRGIGICLKF